MGMNLSAFSFVAALTCWFGQSCGTDHGSSRTACGLCAGLGRKGKLFSKRGLVRWARLLPEGTLMCRARVRSIFRVIRSYGEANES